MPVGERLNAILFLEGLMVPFIGATIRSQVNNFSSATIDIVPTDTAKSLLPRTLCHIFWRDPVDGVFKLVFEGELWGKSFGRSPNGRSMQLNAYSMDYHWHNAKTYYIDPAHSGYLGTGKMIQIINEEGGTEGVPFDSSLGTSSSIGSEISDKADKTPYLTKVLNATLKKLTSRFKYYKIIDERLRVSDRITSATTSNIQKVFDEEKAKKFIYNIAKSGSESRSLYDSFGKLSSVIHHNYVSLAAPSGDEDKIKSFLFKPDCYVTPPPRCNVIFPDSYSSFSYSHQFTNEPTRMQYSYPGEVVQFTGGASNMAKNFYTPSTLAENLGKMSKEAAGISDSKKKRDVFYNHLPYEERLRGVVHGRQPQVPFITQQLREKGQIEKYAGNVASYQFNQQKYAARQVSISCQFDPWLVPGFNSLIVDSSEAKNHTIAHINTVEHRISSVEGAFTSVGIDTARELVNFAWTENMYFDEDLKKVLSDKIDELAIPLWFDETWGTSKTVKLSTLKTTLKTGKLSKKDIDVRLNDFSKINPNYIALLGSRGGESITAWRNQTGKYGSTVIESAYRVIADYKTAKKRNDVENWINRFKQRDLPTITETFNFLKAQTQQKVDGKMVGGVRYSGSLYKKNTGKSSFFDGYTESTTDDGTITVDERGLVSLKRQVVEALRKELLRKDGFRG